MTDINFSNTDLDDLNLDGFDLDNLDNLSDDALMNMFQSTDVYGDIDSDIENVNENICINCEKENTLVLDDKQGIKVCSNCGQVNDNLMDIRPEWRDYEDSKNNRCSAPTNPLLEKSSIGTSISGPVIGNVKRLHSWGMMPYKERSLYNVFKNIEEKCKNGKILKCIQDDAKIFYKKISECKHLKGKNEGKYIIIRGKHRKSLIAACIFFACKKNKKSRSVKEIAGLFDLNYRDVTKGCKTFWKLINLRHIQLSINNSSPEDYVFRFCSELKLDKESIELAQKIAKNVKLLSLASTHTDISIATASILLTIFLRELTITKLQIADKFQVSEVTITKTYKAIEDYKDIIISDEKTNKILKKIEEERHKTVMPPHIAEKFKKFKQKYGNEKLELTEDKPQKTVYKKEIIEDLDDLDDLEELEEFDEEEINEIITDAKNIDEEIGEEIKVIENTFNSINL